MEPFLQNQWLWLIILVPLSLVLSFLLYAKANFPKRWIKVLLIALRAASLALICILLLNPQIKQKSVTLEFPELSILLDQSRSIKDSSAVVNFYNQWKNDQDLNSKFQVNWYGFGLDTRPLDKLGFDESETNIGGAIKNLDRILGQSQGPIIVVTDGQQTIGPAYNYYKSDNRTIYPVILGDTVWPEDLYIQRVTANPIVRKGQAFEVELLVNRTGSSEMIKTRLEAYQKGVKVKSVDVIFPFGTSSQLIQTQLMTDVVGSQTFTWVLKSLPGEQIVNNNGVSLNVEAVDEQRRILLVSDHSHPDIGALTRGLLADDRTEVIQTSPEGAMELLEDIDAVIVYQPSNNFSELLAKIAQERINVWVISGPQTQWSEITKIQPAIKKDQIGVSDALFAQVNKDFSLFKSPLSQWSEMPPLVSDIGQISIEIPHEVLLTPTIQNQPHNSLMLGFLEVNDVRWVVWDGINFWRWRMEAFRLSKSHESFDAFLGILAKYVSKRQEKSVLRLDYKNIYSQRAQAEFYVQYLDKTDAVDLTANIELRMTHQQSKKVITRPLMADTKQYKLSLSDLAPGVYDFTVSVLGTDYQKSGQFEIAPIDSEIGQGYAKIQPMKAWAAYNHVDLQDLSQMGEFKEFLKSQKEFLPRERVEIKNLDFIRWYYALALLILTSALEWFIRKYNGLI